MRLPGAIRAVGDLPTDAPILLPATPGGQAVATPQISPMTTYSSDLVHPMPFRPQRRDRACKVVPFDQHIIGVEGREGEDRDRGPGERSEDGGEDAGQLEGEGTGHAQQPPAAF